MRSPPPEERPPLLPPPPPPWAMLPPPGGFLPPVPPGFPQPPHDFHHPDPFWRPPFFGAPVPGGPPGWPMPFPVYLGPPPPSAAGKPAGVACGLACCQCKCSMTLHHIISAETQSAFRHLCPPPLPQGPRCPRRGQKPAAARLQPTCCLPIRLGRVEQSPPLRRHRLSSPVRSHHRHSNSTGPPRRSRRCRCPCRCRSTLPAAAAAGRQRHSRDPTGHRCSATLMWPRRRSRRSSGCATCFLSCLVSVCLLNPSPSMGACA